MEEMAGMEEIAEIVKTTEFLWNGTKEKAGIIEYKKLPVCTLSLPFAIQMLQHNLHV